MQLDYLKNTKHQVEELKAKLTTETTDQQIISLIKMSEKLAASRLKEMKFKRELTLMVQKEKYLIIQQ